MEENHILWNYSAAAVDLIPPRIEVRSLARIEKQKAQKGIVIVEVGSSRQIEIVRARLMMMLLKCIGTRFTSWKFWKIFQIKAKSL